ncbi:hypothetical protein Bca101_005362 [Brassica carinata]
MTLMQLGHEDYTEFIVSKIKSLTSVDAELLPRDIQKTFRNGSFSILIQDVTGVLCDTRNDVFYVLQSCPRLQTLVLSSVIAVLSNTVSLLANDYHEALQQTIIEPNLGARLLFGWYRCGKHWN